MQNLQDKPVDIYGYNDVRSFFGDYCAARKSCGRNNGFSLRRIAQKAGLRSTGYVTLLLQGKRGFTPETVTKLAVALGFSDAEKAYFMALAKHTHAESDDERTLYRRIMDGLKPGSAQTVLKNDQFEFLTRGYYAVLHQMTLLPDFREDAVWIASRLRARPDPDEVTRAIAVLLRLRILTRDGNGRLCPAHVSFSTAETVPAKEAYRFHLRMFEDAKRTLLETGQEERDFTSMTVPIPISRLPEFKNKLARFRDEIFDWADQIPEKEREVYHFNMQLFPATRQPDKSR